MMIAERKTDTGVGAVLKFNELALIIVSKILTIRIVSKIII